MHKVISASDKDCEENNRIMRQSLAQERGLLKQSGERRPPEDGDEIQGMYMGVGAIG